MGRRDVEAGAGAWRGIPPPSVGGSQLLFWEEQSAPSQQHSGNEPASSVLRYFLGSFLNSFRPLTFTTYLSALTSRKNSLS